MPKPSSAVLRGFNRAWSQRVGALEDSFLGSGRPLGQARLIHEIGPDGVDVLTLRRRTGVDSGYLSRMIRALEADALVRTVTDPADRRRRRLVLTAAGSREWRALEERSERRAAELVAALSPGQRARLDEALTTARRLIEAGTARFEEVPPRAPEAKAAMEAYFAELDQRFPTGFDPGPGWLEDSATMTPPSGTFVVVRRDDDVVACGGVQRIGDGVAEVKRMWVAPECRGTGLGGRLLADLEGRARALGHSVVRLDTHGALSEAIAMYTRAGYREIPRYNNNPYAEHFFEKPIPRDPG